MTTKTRDFQLLKTQSVELLVDLGSYYAGIWTAYGRPRYGKWVLGHFGENIVTSDLCNFIPIYWVMSLTGEKADPVLEDPLYEHEEGYDEIADQWEVVDRSRSSPE